MGHYFDEGTKRRDGRLPHRPHRAHERRRSTVRHRPSGEILTPHHFIQKACDACSLKIHHASMASVSLTNLGKKRSKPWHLDVKGLPSLNSCELNGAKRATLILVMSNHTLDAS